MHETGRPGARLWEDNMKLSDWGRDVLRAALEATASAGLKDSAKELGPDVWNGELSANAVSVALKALEEHLDRLQSQFHDDLPEDEQTWLANDITGIYIIVENLQRASAV